MLPFKFKPAIKFLAFKTVSDWNPPPATQITTPSNKLIPQKHDKSLNGHHLYNFEFTSYHIRSMTPPWSASLISRFLSQLAPAMPWNTTQLQSSINGLGVNGMIDYAFKGSPIHAQGEISGVWG